MPQIHPNARTTPAVRVEIARSSERPGVLAQRYGSAPRPSASGASAVPVIALTTSPNLTACPGKRPGRSVRSCVRFGA